MVEVDLWIFILLVVGTYLNFIQYVSLHSKMKFNTKQGNMNGLVVSTGFTQIASDITNLTNKVERLESIYEYSQQKKKS